MRLTGALDKLRGAPYNKPPTGCWPIVKNSNTYEALFLPYTYIQSPSDHVGREPADVAPMPALSRNVPLNSNCLCESAMCGRRSFSNCKLAERPPKWPLRQFVPRMWHTAHPIELKTDSETNKGVFCMLSHLTVAGPVLKKQASLQRAELYPVSQTTRRISHAMTMRRHMILRVRGHLVQ